MRPRGAARPYRAVHQHSGPSAIGGERSLRAAARTSNARCGCSPAIAVLVLLIACANVASLLVARATRARAGDGAAGLDWRRPRTADPAGADRERASLRSRRARWARSSRSSRHRRSCRCFRRRARSSVWTCSWTGACSCSLAGAGSLVTFLFGLAPAFRASAVSPNDALKSGSGKHTARIGLFRPLVAAQMAFSFVVLFVAGLCLTSFAKLVRTDLGFDQQQPGSRERGGQRLAAGRGEGALQSGSSLLERLEQTPGIESASLSRWGLFEGSGRNKSVRIPGRPVDAYTPWYLPVSPRLSGDDAHPACSPGGISNGAMRSRNRLRR